MPTNTHTPSCCEIELQTYRHGYSDLQARSSSKASCVFHTISTLYHLAITHCLPSGCGLQWRGGDSSMCPVSTLSSIWKTALHATAASARHLPRHSLVGREMNLDAARPPFISLDRLPLPGSARMGSPSLRAGEHISAADEEITVCAALWSDSWVECHLAGY